MALFAFRTPSRHKTLAPPRIRDQQVFTPWMELSKRSVTESPQLVDEERVHKFLSTVGNKPLRAMRKGSTSGMSFSTDVSVNKKYQSQDELDRDTRLIRPNPLARRANKRVLKPQPTNKIQVLKYIPLKLDFVPTTQPKFRYKPKMVWHKQKHPKEWIFSGQNVFCKSQCNPIFMTAGDPLDQRISTGKARCNKDKMAWFAWNHKLHNSVQHTD